MDSPARTINLLADRGLNICFRKNIRSSIINQYGKSASFYSKSRPLPFEPQVPLFVFGRNDRRNELSCFGRIYSFYRAGEIAISSPFAGSGPYNQWLWVVLGRLFRRRQRSEERRVGKE